MSPSNLYIHFPVQANTLYAKWTGCPNRFGNSDYSSLLKVSFQCQLYLVFHRWDEGGYITQELTQTEHFFVTVMDSVT